MNKKQKKVLALIAAAGVIVLIVAAVVIRTSSNKKNNSDSVSADAIEWDYTTSFAAGGDESVTAGAIMSAGIDKEIDDNLEGISKDSEIEDYWGYHNLGIACVDNHLNIREIPSGDGKLVGKMSNGDACEILEVTDDGWAHITSGEIEGYASTDFLLTGPAAVAKANEIITPIATTTGDGVRVREEPNTDCSVITQLPKGEELKVLEELGNGWVKLDLDDEEAYISSDYVTVEPKLTTAITMTELLYGQGVSNVRVDICQYAKQFIGNPYVWGGTSLTKGADCSGFVMSVMAHFGISLPHYSGSQARCGRSVPLSAVKPGDLIFYTRGGTINHVAIYIGNGQVCHASSPKTGIKVSSMYYRTPYKAVNVID